MKWLFIYLLLFIGYQKDTYYVSYIKGKVKLAKTRKLLKIGDEIFLSDSLIYSSKNDFVAMISPQKGRYTVTSENKAKPYEKSQFILAIKDNYFPATKTNTLATRAGMINSIKDVEDYLQSFSSEANSAMLIIDSIRIPLSKSFFTDRENKFFFLRYQYNGETINKELSYHEPKTEADTLCLLLNDEIYTIDEKQIKPDSIDSVTLFYYDAKNKNSTELGTFKLNFVKEEIILPEIKTLVTALNELYKNDVDKQSLILNQILSELEEYYGMPDKEKLIELINRNE